LEGHERGGQALCPRGTFIWISQTFSATQNYRYEAQSYEIRGYALLIFMLRVWLCFENLIRSHWKRSNTSFYSTESQYHQVVGLCEIGIDDRHSEFFQPDKKTPPLSREKRGLDNPPWQTLSDICLRLFCEYGSGKRNTINLSRKSTCF